VTAPAETTVQKEALDHLRSRYASGLIVDRLSTDDGRTDRFETALAIVDASGTVPKLVEKRCSDKARKGTGPGGRPETITTRAVLVLMLMCQMAYKPSELKSMAEEALLLSTSQRHTLGIADDITSDNAYNRVRNAYHRICDCADPFPIKPEMGGDRRTQMTKAQFEQVKAQRDPVEQERNLAFLTEMMNDLIQVPWEMLPRDVRRSKRVDLSVDGTSYPAYGQRPPASSSHIAPSEPDAAWHGRTGDHMGRDGTDVDFFGFEAHLVTTTSTDPNKPVPKLVVGIAMDQPGFRISENTLTALAAASRLRFGRGTVIADRGILPKAKAKDLQLPLRAMGYQLCFDYQRDQLGIQAEHGGAILVDGTWYCPQMPTVLIDATKDYLDGLIDQATFEARIEERRPYQMRYKQRGDKDGHWRFVCPAEDPGARAWCPTKPGLWRDRAGKTHIGVAPDTPGDVCNKHSVTFPADAGAKYAQDLPYKTPEWQALYGKRNTSESANSHFKDPSREAGGEGRRRRVRGFTAQFIFLAGLIVSANLRKLQLFADEQTDSPPPRRRVRRRRPETLLGNYVPEPTATGPPIAA